MADDQFLSTDPAAGAPVAQAPASSAPADSGSDFLSADPDAGTHPMNFAIVNGQKVDLDESPTLRFAKEFYEKSPVGAAVGLGKLAYEGIASGHPLDAALKAGAANIKAQWDEAVKAAAKAKEAANGGGMLSASEAVGHGLAAILPLLGPAAANVGEHFAAGDEAGGAGGALGLLLPFAAKYGLEVRKTGTAFPSTTDVKTATADANADRADILRREAEQQVSDNVLAPGNVRYRGTAKWVAKGLLERGLQGDRTHLQQIADDGMEDSGQRIDDVVNQKFGGGSARVALQPVIDRINNVIKANQVNGETIPTAVDRVNALTALRDYLVKVGPSTPFEALRAIRDDWSRAAAEARGYERMGNNSMSHIGWAAREGASAIRDFFASTAPELTGPNADYAFYKALNDVLDPAQGRPRKVNAVTSGATGGLHTTGAVIGSAVGDTLSNVPGAKGISALIFSKLIPAIREAQASPGWQLAQASKKFAIARALAKGDVGGALYMIRSMSKYLPRESALPVSGAASTAQPTPDTTAQAPPPGGASRPNTPPQTPAAAPETAWRKAATIGGFQGDWTPLPHGGDWPVVSLLHSIFGNAKRGPNGEIAFDTPENVGGMLGPVEQAAADTFAPLSRSAMKAALGDSAERFTAMLKDNPELGGIVKWLHPSEAAALSRMSPEAQAEFARVHEALPSNRFLGAVGQAGIEKRGWYEHSRAAIKHVYGDDADLFAGLLAATSPQNSVEMNLRNATQIYRGWVEAGRPTDRQAILKIMGDNVLGEKGEKSILDSWKNNTIAVLQGGQTISGPKVDSFWRNLRSRAVETPEGPMRPMDAVTLDAWMSNVLGIQQVNFAGNEAQLSRGNPGYSPGYLASTAKIREAATAHDMTPEQLQETIWSWGKALYEQSNETGESAVDIVKRGALSHDAISGTPDFSTLFHQPLYADAIKASGAQRAAKLDTLTPASFPPLGETSAADRQWQLKAAAVLDRLRENREIASDLRVGVNKPGTVNITIPQEGMPGGSTRVAPELATSEYTQGQRDRIARKLLAPNTDVRGENVLLKALGLPTTETTIGLGMWTPPEGGPTQYNTLDAAGVRARIKNATLNQKDSARIMTAAKMQGLLDAQDAVATTGVVYDMAHKDTLHVFTQNKVKQDVFEGLTKLLPGDYALVNKGGGTPGHVIDIIRLDGQPVGATEQELVRGYLAQYLKAGTDRFGRPIPPKIAITPGTNVAGTYVTLPWASGPGSKQVTAAALEDYDTLPSAVKAGLDSDAVKRMASAKLKFWESMQAKRGLTVPEDYRSMLQVVADGGISALRRALDNPGQLLPALLLLGLGRPALETLRKPASSSPQRTSSPPPS